MQSSRVSLTLTFNWKITLLAIFLLPLLLSLGFWQLERADEKRRLLAKFEQRWNAPPTDIDTLDPAALENHQPVTLSGSFSQQQWFLLDNRVRRGQVGYEVLVPFYTREGHWVLVNRGWVRAGATREELPTVQQPSGEITIGGRIHAPAEKPAVLSDDFLSGKGWPKVTQVEDIPTIAAALGHRLLPVAVRIEPTDAAALAAQWQVVNTPPEKHTGYAVQWFAMAAALLLLFVSASSNITAVLRQYWKAEKKV